MAMEKSGYGKDGIYRSLRPPLLFPKDPYLSMVPFLFRNSSSYADRTALADADSGETLTFRHLRSTVYSIAAGLSRLGIKKGDVVLLFAPNSIHFPLCFLAVVSLGAVATTVNPLYTSAEISKQVDDSRPVLVVTVPQLWAKVRDLRLPAVIIGSKNPPIPGSQVTYLSDLVAEPAADLPATPIRQTDTAALLYSSGTTGTSKGVVLTHRSFICTALMATADQENDGEPFNTFLCFLPMFHIFGLSIITFAQLQRGNSVVVMGRFDLEMTLRSIEKFRVTYLFVVPPVMIALAKQSLVNKYDLSSLKRLGSGAAPLGKDIMEECAKNFPHALVVQVSNSIHFELSRIR